MRPLRPSGAPFPPRAVHPQDPGVHHSLRIAAALVFALQVVAIVLASGQARAAQLTLSWTDNSHGAAATRLERWSADDAAFALVANVPAGVTQYVDAGLTPGRIYCYRAAAYDTTRVSGYSASACAKTPPAPVLSVTVKKTGGGMVVSAPDGLTCGTMCSATYPASTVVTLIPRPAAGSAFIGWSGGGPCVGTAPCTVTGNIAVVVTATFGTLRTSASPEAQGSSMNPVLDAINQMLGGVATPDLGQ